MSTTGRFNRGTEPASDREGTRDEVRLPEVVRSEEELVITRKEVESGRVRLVKRIVTESVTRTVEVRREVLHVERLEGVATEPGDREPHFEASDASAESSSSPADRLPDRLRDGLTALQRRARRDPDASAAPTTVGPQFAEGEMEIVLMEEEVVFSKRIVPRERVRLRREVVVDERKIDETLRKEEVEIVHEETTTDPSRADAEPRR